MPVMVDVEPGWVMPEVLVIVKVNVLVCELKLETTVAVDVRPELSPVTVMVSAQTTGPVPAMMDRAATERIDLPYRRMTPSSPATHPSAGCAGSTHFVCPP